MLAMLLAEQGADVIKIERPAGDHLRGTPAFHVFNRSKRAVTLDLESHEARERLRGLVLDADVLLYDDSTTGTALAGALEREARTANPRLIVGHLSAYGSKGRWAHLPPDEGLVQAIAGAQSAQWRHEPRPVYINIPVSGYAQAIVGAGAVAAALYARLRSGRGDRFELSAVAALFQFETTAWVKAPNIMRLAGLTSPLGPVPTYRLFKTSDDWVFVGALTPAFWTKLALAAGLDDALVDERFAGAPMAIADADDRRELARRLEEAFATKISEEWLRILEHADVPRSLVLTREQWAQHEQLRHNGMVVEIDDPLLGHTRQMGVPVRLRNAPGYIRGPAPVASGVAPRWNERGTGSRPETRIGSHGTTPGADYPLAGIRVLDLGTFIAGASCSMMLADYGADVIKIEGPEGDAWRGSGLGFMGSNRNKRGLCIDLTNPEGREAFLEMVARSDVVLDNLRPGIMDRLGIGYASLRTRNPGIVHCSVTAYGPTGPCAHLPGFDPLMQAQGGIMRAQGDPAGDPVYLQIAVCDFASALTAAYGVIAALISRERTGVGDRVETCLANAACTVQAGEFLMYDGAAPPPPGGRDLAGRTASYRIYATSDGAVMVACVSPEHRDALAAALALADNAPLAERWDGPLACELERIFASRTTREWTDTLLAHGVPAAPCIAVADLFDDEHHLANDLWWDTEDPRWGPLRQTGALIKWQALRQALVRRAPQLGEHSIEVLHEFGFDDDRVSRLLDDGVILQR